MVNKVAFVTSEFISSNLKDNKVETQTQIMKKGGKGKTVRHK